MGFFFVSGQGQTDIDQSIKKIKAIIEQHDPCNTTVFCFEYFFRVDKEKKELEIKALRYNYQGKPSQESFDLDQGLQNSS